MFETMLIPLRFSLFSSPRILIFHLAFCSLLFFDFDLHFRDFFLPVDGHRSMFVSGVVFFSCSPRWRAFVDRFFSSRFERAESTKIGTSERNIGSFDDHSWSMSKKRHDEIQFDVDLFPYDFWAKKSHWFSSSSSFVCSADQSNWNRRRHDFWL